MNVIGHDFFTIKTKNSALCDSKRWSICGLYY